MEKQIEEIKQLARDIFERGTALDGIDFVHAAVNGADDDPESHFMRIARHLYVTKGYRKASEVAREIFAEMEKTIRYVLSIIPLSYKDNLKTVECKKECYQDFLGYIAELKKKYESEKDNGKDNK